MTAIKHLLPVLDKHAKLCNNNITHSRKAPAMSGTTRNLATTEAQIVSAGLADLVWGLPDLINQGGSFIRTHATEKAAKRSQRLLYQWLWFHPDTKEQISLRVEGTTLRIQTRLTPEHRGRKGRKT